MKNIKNQLLEEDYPSSIGRTAQETQAQHKRKVKTILPSQSDIDKLQLYLKNCIRKYSAELKANVSIQAWMNLAQAKLVSILLFNRRQAGEIERIFIADYNSYEQIDKFDQSYANFTSEEKAVAMKYVRFSIRGKLNRTVTVLLHVDLLQCCQQLVEHRLSVGVHPKNPYLFGICGQLKGDYKYLRACELMRKFSEECCALSPHLLQCA